MNGDSLLTNLLAEYWESAGTFLFLAFYVCALLVARWLWIVRPSTHHLLAQIDNLRAELIVAANHAGTPVNRESVTAIEAMLQGVAKKSLKHQAIKGLVGNSGVQLYGWRVVHKAERLLTYMWSPEMVRAHLFVLREKLRGIESPEARRLAGEIGGSLGIREALIWDSSVQRMDSLQIPQPKSLELLDPEGSDSLGRPEKPRKTGAEELVAEEVTINATPEEKDAVRRQLLTEGMKLVQEDKDDFFQGLADWHNKIMWLAFTALFIIGVILISRGSNGMLFILGAIGGLLSKLRGVVKKKSLPTDYGVSWGTLFLTPLVGALTGWAGVLLAVSLVRMNVFALQPEELKYWWAASHKPAAMGLAIIFGFSASLFERIMEKVQGEIEKESQRIERRAVPQD